MKNTNQLNEEQFKSTIESLEKGAADIVSDIAVSPPGPLTLFPLNLDLFSPVVKNELKKVYNVKNTNDSLFIDTKEYRLVYLSFLANYPPTESEKEEFASIVNEFYRQVPFIGCMAPPSYIRLAYVDFPKPARSAMFTFVFVPVQDLQKAEDTGLAVLDGDIGRELFDKGNKPTRNIFSSETLFKSYSQIRERNKQVLPADINAMIPWPQPTDEVSKALLQSTTRQTEDRVKFLIQTGILNDGLDKTQTQAVVPYTPNFFSRMARRFVIGCLKVAIFVMKKFKVSNTNNQKDNKHE